MLGCLCYGGGDWLMLYGDTARDGTLYWLTHGVARIPAWRNTLAMALAFLGIILYGIALLRWKISSGQKRNKRYTAH